MTEIATLAVNIVCPHCHTSNSVWSDQTNNTCKQCQQDLFTGHPVNLVDETAFDKHIQHSEIPVLVDFWAPWCGPCHQMAPGYVKVAQQLEPKVRVVKADTEAIPNLSTRYNIRMVPTMMLFSGGKEIGRRPGAMAANDIVRWTQLLLR
ncbi:MAG TPA: thioredoxin TrxC [Burkholderiaceae bacterium]|nr:thioredoxin TrxC [Burkholderiaceae bacterium]